MMDSPQSKRQRVELQIREAYIQHDICHLSPGLKRGFLAQNIKSQSSFLNQQKIDSNCPLHCQTIGHEESQPHQHQQIQLQGKSQITFNEFFHNKIDQQVAPLPLTDDAELVNSSANYLLNEEEETIDENLQSYCKSIPGSGYTLKIRSLNANFISIGNKALYKRFANDNELIQELEESRQMQTAGGSDDMNHSSHEHSLNESEQSDLEGEDDEDVVGGGGLTFKIKEKEQEIDRLPATLESLLLFQKESSTMRLKVDQHENENENEEDEDEKEEDEDWIVDKNDRHEDSILFTQLEQQEEGEMDEELSEENFSTTTINTTTTSTTTEKHEENHEHEIHMESFVQEGLAQAEGEDVASASESVEVTTETITSFIQEGTVAHQDEVENKEEEITITSTIDIEKTEEEIIHSEAKEDVVNGEVEGETVEVTTETIASFIQEGTVAHQDEVENEEEEVTIDIVKTEEEIIDSEAKEDLDEGEGETVEGFTTSTIETITTSIVKTTDVSDGLIKEENVSVEFVDEDHVAVEEEETQKVQVTEEEDTTASTTEITTITSITSKSEEEIIDIQVDTVLEDKITEIETNIEKTEEENLEHDDIHLIEDKEVDEENSESSTAVVDALSITFTTTTTTIEKSDEESKRCQQDVQNLTEGEEITSAGASIDHEFENRHLQSKRYLEEWAKSQGNEWHEIVNREIGQNSADDLLSYDDDEIETELKQFKSNVVNSDLSYYDGTGTVSIDLNVSESSTIVQQTVIDIINSKNEQINKVETTSENYLSMEDSLTIRNRQRLMKALPLIAHHECGLIKTDNQSEQFYSRKELEGYALDSFVSRESKDGLSYYEEDSQGQSQGELNSQIVKTTKTTTTTTTTIANNNTTSVTNTTTSSSQENSDSVGEISSFLDQQKQKDIQDLHRTTDEENSSVSISAVSTSASTECGVTLWNGVTKVIDEKHIIENSIENNKEVEESKEIEKRHEDVASFELSGQVVVTTSTTITESSTKTTNNSQVEENESDFIAETLSAHVDQIMSETHDVNNSTEEEILTSTGSSDFKKESEEAVVFQLTGDTETILNIDENDANKLTIENKEIGKIHEDVVDSSESSRQVTVTTITSTESTTKTTTSQIKENESNLVGETLFSDLQQEQSSDIHDLHNINSTLEENTSTVSDFNEASVLQNNQSSEKSHEDVVASLESSGQVGLTSTIIIESSANTATCQVNENESNLVEETLSGLVEEKQSEIQDLNSSTEKENLISAGSDQINEANQEAIVSENNLSTEVDDTKSILIINETDADKLTIEKGQEDVVVSSESSGQVTVTSTTIIESSTKRTTSQVNENESNLVEETLSGLVEEKQSETHDLNNSTEKENAISTVSDQINEANEEAIASQSHEAVASSESSGQVTVTSTTISESSTKTTTNSQVEENESNLIEETLSALVEEKHSETHDLNSSTETEKENIISTVSDQINEANEEAIASQSHEAVASSESSSQLTITSTTIIESSTKTTTSQVNENESNLVEETLSAHDDEKPSETHDLNSSTVFGQINEANEEAILSQNHEDVVSLESNGQVTVTTTVLTTITESSTKTVNSQGEENESNSIGETFFPDLQQKQSDVHDLNNSTLFEEENVSNLTVADFIEASVSQNNQWTTDEIVTDFKNNLNINKTSTVENKEIEKDFEDVASKNESSVDHQDDYVDDCVQRDFEIRSIISYESVGYSTALEQDFKLKDKDNDISLFYSPNISTAGESFSSSEHSTEQFSLSNDKQIIDSSVFHHDFNVTLDENQTSTHKIIEIKQESEINDKIIELQQQASDSSNGSSSSLLIIEEGKLSILKPTAIDEQNVIENVEDLQNESEFIVTSETTTTTTTTTSSSTIKTRRNVIDCEFNSNNIGLAINQQQDEEAEEEEQQQQQQQHDFDNKKAIACEWKTLEESSIGGALNESIESHTRTSSSRKILADFDGEKSQNVIAISQTKNDSQHVLLSSVDNENENVETSISESFTSVTNSTLPISNVEENLTSITTTTSTTSGSDTKTITTVITSRTDDANEITHHQLSDVIYVTQQTEGKGSKESGQVESSSEYSQEWSTTHSTTESNDKFAELTKVLESQLNASSSRINMDFTTTFTSRQLKIPKAGGVGKNISLLAYHECGINTNRDNNDDLVVVYSQTDLIGYAVDLNRTTETRDDFSYYEVNAKGTATTSFDLHDHSPSDKDDHDDDPRKSSGNSKDDQLKKGGESHSRQGGGNNSSGSSRKSGGRRQQRGGNNGGNNGKQKKTTVESANWSVEDDDYLKTKLEEQEKYVDETIATDHVDNQLNIELIVNESTLSSGNDLSDSLSLTESSTDRRNVSGICQTFNSSSKSSLDESYSFQTDSVDSLVFNDTFASTTSISTTTTTTEDNNQSIGEMFEEAEISEETVLTIKSRLNYLLLKEKWLNNCHNWLLTYNFMQTPTNCQFDLRLIENLVNLCFKNICQLKLLLTTNCYEFQEEETNLVNNLLTKWNEIQNNLVNSLQEWSNQLLCLYQRLKQIEESLFVNYDEIVTLTETTTNENGIEIVECWWHRFTLEEYVSYLETTESRLNSFETSMKSIVCELKKYGEKEKSIEFKWNVNNWLPDCLVLNDKIRQLSLRVNARLREYTDRCDQYHEMVDLLKQCENDVEHERLTLRQQHRIYEQNESMLLSKWHDIRKSKFTLEMVVLRLKRTQAALERIQYFLNPSIYSQLQERIIFIMDNVNSFQKELQMELDGPKNISIRASKIIKNSWASRSLHYVGKIIWKTITIHLAILIVVGFHLLCPDRYFTVEFFAPNGTPH